MKKVFVFVICLLIMRAAQAQKPSLAINEHNVYIYYEVVDLPGISADSLKRNATGFVATVYQKNGSKKISEASVSVKDKFLTYTSFVKHEDGEIAYTLNIECKDAKYRYWVTDFVYTPYERNRYGVFVPSPGIDIPLETVKTKVDKRTLESYLNQTGLYCKQLADKLKLYMATGHGVNKTDQQPAKIVTDKW